MGKPRRVTRRAEPRMFHPTPLAVFAPVLLRRLGPGDAAAYASHLLRLPGEDRRLRFYGAVGEGWVRDHARAAIAGCERVAHGAEAGPHLRAAALCVPREEGAELGLSVEPGWRRIGLGRALVARLLRDAAQAGCRRALLPLEPEAPGLRALALACGAALAEGGWVAEFALAPPGTRP